MYFKVLFVVALYILAVYGNGTPAVESQSNSNEPLPGECVDTGKYGCLRGYCWSYCHGAFPWDSDWCWTTRGRSQDYNYVECENNFDCNGCWSCAGPCTI